MITILSADSYRGFSALVDSGHLGAQPAFIGRIVWPGCDEAEDAFIKMYEANTCGTANEAIGFTANQLRGVAQPKKGAVLLLSKRELPQLGIELRNVIDAASGMAVCWATSFEQDTKPFRYLRKPSSLSEKQSNAFYKSRFCQLLATVDHVTGNNDRHEGNFLYRDDLNYLAIDQGCIGGGLYWHTMYPDNLAKNQIALLAQQHLASSHLVAWRAAAIMEYERAQTSWLDILKRISASLPGLLTTDEIDIIIEYMTHRASGPSFAVSCEKLI
jgi:hypothetical protein